MQEPGVQYNQGLLSLCLNLTPCTDVASHLLAIDLRLDVRIACDGLQQKFQHAEYFTCDPSISQPILIQFSRSFHHSAHTSSCDDYL